MLPARAADPRARWSSFWDSVFNFMERRLICISPSIAPGGFERTKPCAGWSGRRNYLPTISSILSSSPPAARSARRSAPCPASPSSPWTWPLKRQERLTGWASRRSSFSASPGKRTCGGRKATPEPGIVQQAIRAIKGEIPDLVGHHRCLPLRVHQPRPLRPDRERGGGQRCDVGTPCQNGPLPCRSRGRHGGAIRHDGRTGQGHSGNARQTGLSTPPDHGLCRQTRLGFLWSLPRGRRIHSPVRGPQILPDGPGQCSGSCPGGGPRRPGRGGYHHGQTGASLLRHHPRRPGRIRPSGGGLQRQRRIFHDQSRLPSAVGSTRNG